MKANQIYLALLALNLLLLFLKSDYLKNIISFKVFQIILISIFSFQFFVFVISDYLDNNLYLFHIYNPIEFALYSLFFSEIITSKSVKKLILIFIPFFLLISFLLGAYVQKLDVNSSYVVAIESIILIIYSLIFLRQIFIYEIEEKVVNNSLFWFAIGILVYFVGTLFIDGFLDLLMKENLFKARKYYKYGFIFKYLQSIMFIIGIFVIKSCRISKVNWSE